MADPDAHQNATLPVAFNRFIEVMNMEQAKDLVRSINSFMKEFKQRAPNPEADSQAVQAFLQQMETAMAKHPLFANSTPQEQDAATEALEKYLMTKLHERTFRQSADDVERDELLAIRCAALQFVVPAHLEIPDGVVDEAALGRAAAELNKINNYKAPRDKLVCILNCCRMLNNLLTSRSKAEGIGADDFTPLLIYLVIRARPSHLASNLAYIERYRYHTKLTSETQYYYIQLCSAATFIEMMDATSLKVNPDEFIAHMLAAGAMSDEQLAMMQSNSSSMDGATSPHHPTRNGVSKSTAQATAQAAAAGIKEPAGGWQQHPPHTDEQPLQMQPLPAVASVTAWNQQQHQQPPHSYGQQQHLQHQPYQYSQQQLQHQQPYQQQQYYQQPAPQQPQQHYSYQQQQYYQQQHHHQQQQQPQPQRILPPPAPLLPSLSELEAQGAALLAAKGPAVSRQLAGRHPFSCSSLDSLSLGDVGKLLAAYKELVLRHEALTAALEQRRQLQQQQATAGQPSSSWVPLPPPNPPSPAPCSEPIPAASTAAGAGAAAAAAQTAAVPPPPQPSAADDTQVPAVAPPLHPPLAANVPSAAVAAQVEAAAPGAGGSQEGKQQQGEMHEDAEAAAAAGHTDAWDDLQLANSEQQPAAETAPGADVATVEPGLPAAGAVPLHPPAATDDAAAASQSQVDALLDALLDEQQPQQQQQPVGPVSNQELLGDGGVGSMKPAVPAAQQQIAAVSTAAGAEEDDLFGAFQQPSMMAAAETTQAVTSAPSLLD